MAVECAHRHLAEVGVAWLSPRRCGTGLKAEFGRLEASGGLLDPRAPFAAAHGALADGRLPWLAPRRSWAPSARTLTDRANLACWTLQAD